QQDEQADDHRQHRLVDEDVGEFHRLVSPPLPLAGEGRGEGGGPVSASVSMRVETIPILAFPLQGKAMGGLAARGRRPYRFSAHGASSADGCTLLLIVTSASLRSFSRPLVATRSPGLSPSVTTIMSPRVAPVLTKRWVTTSFLPVNGWPCMSVSPS